MVLTASPRLLPLALPLVGAAASRRAPAPLPRDATASAASSRQLAGPSHWERPRKLCRSTTMRATAE
eukprot:6894947-Alexandrium_andersonii.AAC.1